MGSLKAIFLTFLMTLVYYIPQGILALLVKFADWPINLFHPGFELVWAASSLLVYLLIFYWFWKPKPSYNSMANPKGFNYTILFFLV